MEDLEILRHELPRLGLLLCESVRDVMREKTVEQLSGVAREARDDTIYCIDADTEDVVVDFFEREIGPRLPCVLVAEGLAEGGMVFGGSGRRSDARATVIMDPLDGTRGLMYGKRSAWSLAGAARGASDSLSLADIAFAVQTEIPPPAKQSVADQLSAEPGRGARGLRINLDTKSQRAFQLRPSGAKDLNYGFASFSRFFPGTKSVITEIETEFCAALERLGQEHFYFEDQYICSGGQLAELAAGRDRFVCDLRAAVAPALEARGAARVLCVHPYDVCSELIAREAGVIVTDCSGRQLCAPLDTTTNVAWIGYANEHLRKIIEPVLLDIITMVCDRIS